MTGVACTCLSIGVFGTLIIFPDTFSVQSWYPPTVSANFINTTNVVTSSHAIDLDSIVVETNWNDEADSVITYVVQAWDTLSEIARIFGTTTQILKETNDIVNEKYLRAGQRIFISETSGFVFQLESVTNLMVFANQYDIDLASLWELNDIVDPQEALHEWQEIFVPLDREKGIELWLLSEPESVIAQPQPVLVQTPAPTVVRRAPVQAQREPQQVVRAPQATQAARVRSSSSVSYSSNHIIRKWTDTRWVSNSFYRGYCTRWAALEASWMFPYVSKNRQIRGFGWHAESRIRNAKAAWYYTSSTPTVDAIMVVSPTSSNRYGHVWVVKQVNRAEKKILVRDMNFSGKFIFTDRWVYMNDSMTQPIKNSPPLRWFIPKQAHPQRFQEQIDAYNN